MLLVLLYHRIGEGKNANPLKMMERHFEWISRHYRVILPGESLRPFSLDICLTFDDASYDFYHYIFPMLKKLHLRALLAVPVGLIEETTSVDPSIRLSVPYSAAMKEKSKTPYCTFKELKEMAHSGFVQMASHSYSHKNLILNDQDLDFEIIESKRILEEKLSKRISTFVYPLGKFNPAVHQKVKEHYEFAMRIGSSWNTSWQNQSQITYRVIADQLRSFKEPFRVLNRISYSWFYLLNSIRGR